MMQLGPNGLALLKSFEKCRLLAYRDMGGVWTVGWGHTGPNVTAGTVCTQEQADAWLAEDVQAAAKAVTAHTDVPLTQNQFDALVAFTFNVGAGHFLSSTLLRLVNAGRFADAALEFPKWDHVDGQVSAGLAARRAAEQRLFLQP